jgi:hypothetical protein
VGQSIIGDGCFQALAQREYGLSNGRSRQSGVQQLGDPTADGPVGDLVQRDLTEVGKDLVTHDTLEARPRRGAQVMTRR